MARSYATTALLRAIRRKSFTAGASRDFPDQDIIDCLNEQATSYLLSLIAKRGTNFLVETVDITVSAGVPAYPIPSVAIGGCIRAAVLVVGGIPNPLREKSITEALETNVVTWTAQWPDGFYFQDGNIVLHPTQALSGVLRLAYHRRPSEIVSDTQAPLATATPNNGATALPFSLSGAGAPGFYRITVQGPLNQVGGATSFQNGTLVDIVSNIPNFYRWQTSVALANVNGATNQVDVPFNAAGVQPPGIQATGDWLCLADKAPVVTSCPAEVIEALLWSVVLEMFAGKGADQSYARAKDKLADAEMRCGQIIQRRNTGAQPKVSAFADSPGWIVGYP